MHRFFVEPALLTEEHVVLGSPIAHQICHVLRLQPGARILLLDGEGQQAEAVLEGVAGREVRAFLLSKGHAPGEPRVQVTLYQSLLRNQRFEWVLQKGTELGVTAFVPVLSERCVARPADVVRKRARWQAIVREAAEQSERGRLPSVALPVAFPDACEDTTDKGPTLMAWEERKGVTLRRALSETMLHDGEGERSLGLFIGPEGGFTAAEAALASAHGIRLVDLGPRVLRAETAAIAALAALSYALGEWDVP